MLSDPVFIVGTERSGSNLLRLLLDAHTSIAIPHPPHVMRDLAPLEKLYGDLRRDGAFSVLAGDMAALVNLHFAPWPFKVEGRELVKRAETRSLYGLYAALYALYAERMGKPRWGCKSTFMGQQIRPILAHHSQPRILHLVRDPRDVAASAGESVFSKFHPWKQAELWEREQKEIERWKPELGPRRCLLIRYEDLTSSPESELKRIMAFLGEEFEPAQLEYFRAGEASRLAQLSGSWRNLASPVSTTRVRRYRARLGSKEISWVEARCFDRMRDYGYEPESAERPCGPRFVDLIGIASQERLRKLRVEGRALFEDSNFTLRWKRWAYLRYLRGARSLTHG